MVRRIGFIGFLLALYIPGLILSPKCAAAAEVAPGDACNAAQAAHTFEWTNPTNGVSNAVFCESGTWNGIINLQAATGYVGIGNTAPGALLDIGTAGTTLGTMRLEGNTSGYLQIQPAAAAGSVTFTLPATVGSAGQQLTTDGASPATLTWAAAGGASLNGITAATASQAGIANAAYTIVWNWDTLTTGTALKIASTSMTTGTLLNLSNTNAANSTGVVLNVSNSEVGVSYAIEGTSATTTTYGAAICQRRKQNVPIGGVKVYQSG